MLLLKRYVPLIVVLSLLLSTTGCKKLIKSLKGGDGGDAPITSTTTDPDEQLEEKVQEYIDCLNALSSDIHQTETRYFSWAPRGALTGKERYVYGLYKIDSTAECTASAQKGAQLPPKDPKLEAAGSDFAAKAAVLEPLIKQAYDYYEQKNYKDDAFAKGKSIHTQLVAAFEAFDKADDTLHDTVDAITRPLQVRALARIEKEDGRKFYYHRKNTLIQARATIESAAPARDGMVDFNAFATAQTAFEKAFADLKDYGTAHRAELSSNAAVRPPHWPVAESHFDSFIRSAETYAKKSKGFFRCLRDAPAKAKGKDGKVNPDLLPRCDDGNGKEVLKAYNDFIRTSNNNLFP